MAFIAMQPQNASGLQVRMDPNISFNRVQVCVRLDPNATPPQGDLCQHRPALPILADLMLAIRVMDHAHWGDKRSVSISIALCQFTS